MEVLVVENVRKVYDERVEALRGVSLRINEGEVYGLIGPNGAGKTTLLRIIVGLMKPTSGYVRVMGEDPFADFDVTRKYIGYLPEEAGTYPLLTGIEHLSLYARIYGESQEDIEKMIKFGSEISRLGDMLYERTSDYSHGMKRRLLIALVLMRMPKLAVLDEPTSGLDVYASVSVRKMIREYAKSLNAAVILSSHNMLEIENTCDRVGIIYRGRILAEGRPRDLISQFNVNNLEEVFVTLIEREGGAVMEVDEDYE